MNTPIRLFLVIVISFCAVSQSAFAQRFIKKKKYLSIGGTLNAMNYVGELDPGSSFISPSLRYTRPNLGLTVTYRMAPRVSMRGTFAWGRIKGNDAVSSTGGGDDINRKIRNFNFRSTIWELKGDVIIDLFENRSYSEKRPDYTPYAFIGLAFFHHNPKTNSGANGTGGSWEKIQGLNAGETFSLNQIAIPLGLGFRYKLAKHLDLAFEIGWRKTFTDYLDGMSANYGDPRLMTPEQRALIFKSSSQVQFAADNGFTTYSNLVDPLDPLSTPLVGFVTGHGGEFVLDDPISPTKSSWKSDQRGDKNSDWYIVSGFHLTYIFPRQVVCPKFRY